MFPESKSQNEHFLLPVMPSMEELYDVLILYKIIVSSNLKFIINRWSRNVKYPWIDTKYDPVKKQDFPESDLQKGKQVIYTWIQTRALEALSIHAKWIRKNSFSNLSENILSSIDEILTDLLKALFHVRESNGGHLFFTMTPEGIPLKFNKFGKRIQFHINEKSPYNLSDIFAAKGMLTAAAYLQIPEYVNEAKKYVFAAYKAVIDNSFVSDQQQFDYCNPVKHIPGRISHGPFMLLIGAAIQLFAEDKNKDNIDFGLDIIENILKRHVIRKSHFLGLSQYDFIEFIDMSGNPYISEKQILCDPGHALEFVGLTLKFTFLIKKYPDLPDSVLHRIKQIESDIFNLLEHNFSQGFNSNIGGITKLIDLRSHRVSNPMMPWWSLPETMRASLECGLIEKSDENKKRCLNIYALSHNSFVNNYLLPSDNYLQIQALSQDGTISNAIPAVPDIDPCYHTGLCLLDIIDILKTRSGQYS